MSNLQNLVWPLAALAWAAPATLFMLYVLLMSDSKLHHKVEVKRDNRLERNVKRKARAKTIKTRQSKKRGRKKSKNVPKN